MSVAEAIGDMQPASFRGVNFAVVVSETRFGRRIALHEYPFRDTPWPEDVGRGTRKFSIQGFLITDSFVYGGGEVSDQRDSLVAAVETKGAGTLIHPTLGRLQVSIPEDGLVISERLDARNYMEFTLACYEDGERKFPAAEAEAGDSSEEAADDIDSAAAEDYEEDVAETLDYGPSILEEALDVATGWADLLTDLAYDATGIFNLAAALPGNFGRFFNGALVGYAASLLPAAVFYTLEDLVFASAQRREDVTVAGARLMVESVAQEAAGPPAAAAAAAAALVAAIANPADGIRIVSRLADFYPVPPIGVSPVSVARRVMGDRMATMLRRSALAALVRVTASYQPRSTEDANAVRLQVVDLLDREALYAGDAGDDRSYVALTRALAAVSADLDTRGAKLPPMRDFVFPSSMPSLVLAYRLYQDTTRADQLVDLANPRHPAFMPFNFKALAS